MSAYDYSNCSPPLYDDYRILSLCDALSIQPPMRGSNDTNFILEVLHKQSLEILEMKKKLYGDNVEVEDNQENRRM